MTSLLHCCGTVQWPEGDSPIFVDHGFAAVPAKIGTVPRMLRLGRWCLAAVLTISLCGCAGWNVKDEGFSENDLSQSARKARPPEKDVDYWSFSNKGRQIERDLHAL